MLRPVDGAPGLRVEADGTLHLPAGCDLLHQLYANHGVRVRMVKRPPRREKIPTVRQLIDDLSKKHEQMLEVRAKAPQWSCSSSSTSTVPFSSTDLLYGNGEGSGFPGSGAGSGLRGHVDEVAAGDLGAWDTRGADKKLKELDLHGNKRPTSRGGSRKNPNYDKVSFEREREELRPLANSLPPSKQSPLRNGLKNNLLRADQILTQRANGAAGREEDLVAMGTLWSPSQLTTRGSSTGTSSGKSTSGPITTAFTSTSGSLSMRRPINLSTSTSTRQLLHQNSIPSSLTVPSGAMGNAIKSTKEVEPKYSDPLSGATASFQQRLMELAALEAETVRWERSKKVKKKSKPDRDS